MDGHPTQLQGVSEGFHIPKGFSFPDKDLFPHRMRLSYRGPAAGQRDLRANILSASLSLLSDRCHSWAGIGGHHQDIVKLARKQFQASSGNRNRSQGIETVQHGSYILNV